MKKNRSTEMEINTGIDASDRADMAKQLGAILDSSYSLLVRTHVYHWNVKGPLFEPLHVLLEQQYKALFEAVDEIAERILQLGFRAPSTSASTFPTGLKKAEIEVSAGAMIEDLLEHHESACRKMREAGEAADEMGDLVTNDMLSGMIGFHEKAAWMLRSTLAGWKPTKDAPREERSAEAAAKH